MSFGVPSNSVDRFGRKPAFGASVLRQAHPCFDLLPCLPTHGFQSLWYHQSHVCPSSTTHLPKFSRSHTKDLSSFLSVLVPFGPQQEKAVPWTNARRGTQMESKPGWMTWIKGDRGKEHLLPPGVTKGCLLEDRGCPLSTHLGTKNHPFVTPGRCSDVPVSHLHDELELTSLAIRSVHFQLSDPAEQTAATSSLSWMSLR